MYFSRKSWFHELIYAILLFTKAYPLKKKEELKEINDV